MKAFILIAGSFLIGLFLSTKAFNQEKPSLSDQLSQSIKRVTSDTYQLRYRFKQGDVVRWTVEQVASTETVVQGNKQIAGNRQRSESQSRSVKQWRIDRVDANGNITLVHSVESANMWQKVSDGPEIRYNSESGEKPPLVYEHLAETIGIPLATVTIDPSGNIIKKEANYRDVNLGMGGLTIPFPKQPIKIDARWHIPGELVAKRQDGSIKRIKTRMAYHLKSVKHGVATIAVRTEVLTPIQDPRIESQIVQQLTEGEIKFDLEAGRLVSRQVNWDKVIVGFSGPDSMMKYVARLTEKLVPAGLTPPVRVGQRRTQPAVIIRGRFDRPVLRR